MDLSVREVLSVAGFVVIFPRWPQISRVYFFIQVILTITLRAVQHADQSVFLGGCRHLLFRFFEGYQKAYVTWCSLWFKTS